MELDPRLFSPDAIDSETNDFNRKLKERLATEPPLTEFPPDKIRARREQGNTIWGPIIYSDTARDILIPGLAGEIQLRTFVPETVRGVYLHIHGGGWVLGSANWQDSKLEKLSEECELAVVSVGYRLAPEHPYPAGPDDCEAAALWLVENAKQEFGSERLLIGGESAGAHLSVVTLLRMRDRHNFTGFAGANLVYGVYDLTMTPSSRNWGDHNFVLSTPIMEWFSNHFVEPDLRSQPDVSPLYADLHGLPPALFTVGTLDPLLDDSLFMAQRWWAAGNITELAIYPGGPHGFDVLGMELGRSAVRRCLKYLKAVE